MSLWDLIASYQSPVIIFDVTIYFTNYGLYELGCIGLFQGLVQMYDIAHRLCVEGTWVTHAVLKGQLVIMELGIVKHSLSSHVMHALVSVELPLGN